MLKIIPKNQRKKFIFTIVVLHISIFNFFAANAQNIELTNDRYSVTISTDSMDFLITENASGVSEYFTSEMGVLKRNSTADVSLTRLDKALDDVTYSTLTWDGNQNLYSAGTLDVHKADSVYQDSVIHFVYPNIEAYQLRLGLKLPPGDQEPVIEYSIIAKYNGFYSISYLGSPVYEISVVDEIWQPMVWIEKRFPQKSYLTPNHLCALPGSFVTNDQITSALIADPDEYPFEPMPTFDRSTFGVAIRNQNAQVHPMIWAPIIGRANSYLSSGTNFSFRALLYVSEGNMHKAQEQVSRRIYGFDQYSSRDNALESLNATLYRMIDYGMSEYSLFDEELKGCAYIQDVPNSVKNVSALNPFNVAFVCDDTTIMKERAFPIMEYLLSRESNNFSLTPTSGVGGQKADNSLGYPYMISPEASALYTLSNHSSGFFLDLAKDKRYTSDLANENAWRDNFMLYRASGDESFLSNAVSGASMYINDRIKQMETGFTYQHNNKSSFWIFLAPKYVDLFEMYETTQDITYLDAAHEAARRYARYIWMSPKVPDQSILVNPGNEAPVYWYAGGDPMYAPEEEVPAWRLSAIGLTSEASGTGSGEKSHRAIFMAHHAPYMLRLAALTGDDYLRDIAQSAITGRWRNFPGYHMNTDRTTVFDLPDFPLHSHEEISATSMHYNHVWPMISLIIDYLISDVYDKSNGQIDFPSEYVQGYAYLQSKIYGHQPGTFYGEEGVTFYMPRNMAETSNKQVNYIAARGNDKLYFAFTNQSDEDIISTITLNQEALPFDLSGAFNGSVWEDNQQVGTVSMSGGSFDISVSAKGITAVAFDNVEITTKLQDRVLNNDPARSWTNDYRQHDFALTYAMYINFGERLREAYLYSGAEHGDYKKITLNYFTDTDSTMRTVVDNAFPFEFEIPLATEDRAFHYKFTTTDAENNIESSEWYKLSEETPVSAVLSGYGVIVSGEQTSIKVDLLGTPPWEITYSDGEKNYTLSDIQSSPYSITVSPEVTTTYSMVSVTDATGAGETDGQAKIVVGDKTRYPFLDGMVRQYWKDGEWDAEFISVKNSASWAREAFFSFDISDMVDPLPNVMFRLYFYQSDVPGNIIFSIDGIEQTFDESLDWNNKPSDAAFTTAGAALTRNQDDLNSYFVWDITDYFNNLIANEQTEFSLRVYSRSGSEALNKFKSMESDSDFKPMIIFDTGVTEIGDESGIIIDEYALFPNFPNPFNPQTTIRYALKERIHVKLDIYNINGQLVKRLIDEEQNMGYREARWNGTNAENQRVASGLYFIQFQAEDFIKTQKMVLIK